MAADDITSVKEAIIAIATIAVAMSNSYNSIGYSSNSYNNGYNYYRGSD
jgi:hypothetical protein